MDECQYTLKFMNTHIAIFSETWFNPEIPDAQWDINGYHLFSKPRQGRKGGGLAIYVKDNIHAESLAITTPEDLECLWIKVRPPRLPRELSSIAVCAVYIPPNSPHTDALTDHLSTVVDQLRSASPDVGVCIAGDFNRTDVSDLCRGNHLQQIVDQPTRKDATLDLIITNLAHLYIPPALLPPLGSSDHNIVHLQPKARMIINETRTKTVRPMPDSQIRTFGQWIVSHQWSEVLTAADVQSKTDNFYRTMAEKIDQHFPTKSSALPEPKVILFHVGTNDIRDAPNAATVTEGLRGLIETTHDKYPRSSIVMSSILPRDNPNLQDIGDDVNSFLKVVSDETTYVHTTDNSIFSNSGTIKKSLYNADGYHPITEPLVQRRCNRRASHLPASKPLYARRPYSASQLGGSPQSHPPAPLQDRVVANGTRAPLRLAVPLHVEGNTPHLRPRKSSRALQDDLGVSLHHPVPGARPCSILPPHRGDSRLQARDSQTSPANQHG
ncbi:hypothetical protein Bbelb_402920 [Branchiostoma belcheri]|nr:hypothetical protein Bbelb_402920 [Branchiostoma belcheri]